MPKKDVLAHYEESVDIEIKLRQSMYSLYKKYWSVFFRRLSCSEKFALNSYKFSSGLMNSILWLPQELELVRRFLSDSLGRSVIEIRILRTLVIEILNKVVADIAKIESLFVRAPILERETIVFRGISGKFTQDFSNLRIGQEWTPKNYVSTSFNFYTALQFGVVRAAVGDQIIIRILLPKGTPYLLLPGSSPESADGGYSEAVSFKELIIRKNFAFDEMELLINKNSTFELIGKEKIKLAQSQDFFSTSYTKNRNINIYSVRLVSTDHAKFEIPTSDLATMISSIPFSILSPVQQ